jgi:hypothetical protein
MSAANCTACVLPQPLFAQFDDEPLCLCLIAKGVSNLKVSVEVIFSDLAGGRLGKATLFGDLAGGHVRILHAGHGDLPLTVREGVSHRSLPSDEARESVCYAVWLFAGPAWQIAVQLLALRTGPPVVMLDARCENPARQWRPPDHDGDCRVHLL